MVATPNFSLVTELSQTFARATVFNELARQLDTLLLTFKTDIPFLIQVRNMKDDSDQSAAPPGGAVNGDGFVVNNWGGGNYVGAYTGVFADGDIAERNDALGGFVRVLTNVGGIPVLNTRVIVKAAGAAGSFATLGNSIAEYNGTWAVPYPVFDGMRALVIGEQTVWENQTFVYDLVTAGWYSTGVTSIPTPNVWFVNKGGNDTTGGGGIETPFLTIDAAMVAPGFADGDTIYVGPGVYAETLAILRSLNIVEMIPGTVTIQNAVVGGAVVTVTPPAAGTAFVRLRCNIINTNNATAADIALLLDNVAGVGTGTVIFNGEVLNGGALGTALSVVGDNAGQTLVTTALIDNATITGALAAVLETASDLVRHNNCTYVGGAAGWTTISGPNGRYIIDNSRLPTAGAAETLNFGNGTACGVNLILGSFDTAGVLNLNSTGTGLVTMTGATRIGTILASQEDQIVQRWLGADEFKITMYNIDVNAIASHTMYTTGGGRRFNPHTARTINRGGATGALLNHQFDGSGAASVVAASGGVSVAQGIKNETVVQDSIAPAGSLAYNVTVASGAADFVDAEAIGRLF